MTRALGALLSCLMAGCAPAHTTGELGAVQYGYCDPEWFGADGLCSGSTPIAVGGRALLFVHSPDGLPISSVASDDAAVLEVAPSGVSSDFYIVSAHAQGSASLSVLGTDGAVLDRFVMTALDIAEIRAGTQVSTATPVRVPPGGRWIGFDCYSSDGRQLAGLAALDLVLEGVDGDRHTIADEVARSVEPAVLASTWFTEGVHVTGPVEGGTGRVVATAPSGVSVEVPLVIERARVESIELRVVETSEDQGRIAATIEVEAGREACCEWSVMPEGGPITIRRAECDYVLVDSSRFGIPTGARLDCAVLDSTESIAITVGVRS